jgi:hypothetical protein
MTYMAKKMPVIPRRALLRGAGGIGLALPWLEAMLPRKAEAQAAAVLPRSLFVYFSTGYKNGNWIPSGAAGVSTNIALTPTAAALMPYKAKLNVITGAGNTPAAFGNGGDGIHARATGTFLMFEHLLKTGFLTGVSADQLIARAVGTSTCVPSLVTGIPGERLPGFDEDGYGEVYLDNISFTGPRSNVAKDSNPQTLFRRLVTCASLKPTGTTTTGGAPPPMVDPAIAERAKFEQSVMSSVKAEAKRLSSCVGVDDRQRLDQYYQSITELEQRFTTSMPGTGTGGGTGVISAGCVQPAEPPAAGALFADSVHLMMDVIIFAFRCGLTRVGTMMLDGAFSRRNYGLPNLNGADYIHGLSHGEIGGKTVDHPRWVAITTHYFENFAYLLQQMDSIKEGDKTLLDNSIVYINSEFGDGDAHNQQDLPTIIAGGASGKFKQGQLISLARQTPVSNVVLTIMQTMGLNQPSFGDSTGIVSSLLV